jgi:two-component sensor histidine kinase
MVEELAAQYGGKLVLRNDGGLRAEVRIRRERL